jgi:hypothetical protein
LSGLPNGGPVGPGNLYAQGTLPARLPLTQSITLDNGMVTVGPALHQFSHFTVDVTPFYQTWTRANGPPAVAAIIFVTIDEATVAGLPVANGGPTWCLAHYGNFVLDVESL